MKRMYEEGLSIRAIAQRLDRQNSVVSRSLRNHGVPIRPAHVNYRPWRLPYESVRQVIDLYAAGRSHREIGRELGLAESTVRYRLRKAGVRPRNRTDAQTVRFHGVGALKAVSGRSGYVPAQPVARLVAEMVGQDGELALSRQSGVSDKLLRNLRNGQAQMEWTSADKILTALDALWFDAYEEGTDEYVEAAAVWEAA